MSARVRPEVARPRSSAGNVCSLMNSALLNGWTRNPSATSPATSVIPSPTPARKILAQPDVARLRGEERRHQRVAVDLAFELQRRAVLPRRPDRADREHHLAHARRRARPRHREPLLDVRLDLRSETEDGPPGRERLEVPADVREVHRAARESRPRSRSRGRCARCARPRGPAGRTDRAGPRTCRRRRSPSPRSRARSPALRTALASRGARRPSSVCRHVGSGSDGPSPVKSEM